MKLAASSILYALIIIVVLALTSTALITLSSYQKMLFERDGLQERLSRHAVSGMELLLKSRETIGKQPMLLPLGRYLEDTILLSSEPWGMFDLVNVRVWRHTVWREEEVSLTALIGLSPDSIGQAALYLPDNAQPLSLVGDSHLRGTAYLSQKGVKAGMVDTRGFSGIHLLEGDERRSGRNMPLVDTSRISTLQAFKSKLARGQSKLTASTIVPFDSAAMRMTGKTIRLDGQYLEGKIVVVADSLIRVGKTAHLKDILLFAPVIQIDSGFIGIIQAFASNNIIVGDNVTLPYPSALVVLGNRRVAVQGMLTIGERCSVGGLVFSWGDGARRELLPKVFIGKGTVIMGQVYADGWLDLKGTVNGNVSCRNFLLQTPTSIYENHLLDATIDASKRPPYFIGSMLIGDGNVKKGLVKWLRN